MNKKQENRKNNHKGICGICLKFLVEPQKKLNILKSAYRNPITLFLTLTRILRYMKQPISKMLNSPLAGVRLKRKLKLFFTLTLTTLRKTVLLYLMKIVSTLTIGKFIMQLRLSPQQEITSLVLA